MDILNEAREINRKSFLGHVFSTSDEGKAEIFNVVQYASLGVVPIVILNKMIQRFVPEADSDKSSLELLVEIFIQIVVMFCGIIIIHRIITFVPTYSGFKYDNLILTNVILAFLVIVLSIQTKLGIKVNIVVDRVTELWNGPEPKGKMGGGNSRGGQHVPSQADFLDHSGMQSDMFPPAPAAPVAAQQQQQQQQRASSASAPASYMDSGPMAANGVLGGGFGTFF
jgi:hypothetical protein